MITLVTSELSSGFRYFIESFRMNQLLRKQLNVSFEYLSFPEVERTELEIFDWVKNQLTYQTDISILTNSYIVRDLFRLAIYKGKLDHKNFQNLFIDRKNLTYFIHFDEDGRTNYWIDNNLDLGEKILSDLCLSDKSNQTPYFKW